MVAVRRTPEEAFGALFDLPAGEHLRSLEETSERCWLVGGAVRDLMLGGVPEDFDIAVEGEAGEVAQKLGEVVEAHPDFGTFRSLSDAGSSFDVARCRTETYELPGSLPVVTFVDDIQRDLERRDFTVGTLAVRLSDGKFVAHEQALGDLTDGTVRVLHADSLKDDPTRAWRAARYCARLGFSIDSETQQQIGAADPDSISGDRHRNELELCLGEDSYPQALGLLRDWAPGFVPAGLSSDTRLLESATALLSNSEHSLDALKLAALTWNVEPSARRKWFERLNVAGSVREIFEARENLELLGRIEGAKKSSEVFEIGSRLPNELIALLGGSFASRWFSEVQSTQLSIDGSDLLAAGLKQGPEIGIRLKQAHAALLDGELDPKLPLREAELKAAGL